MKTPPFKYLLICCILPLLALKCKAPLVDYRYPLYLQNNDTSAIVAYIALGYNNTPVYPDTSLPEPNPILSLDYAVKPGSKQIIHDSSTPWGDIYQDQLNGTLLSIYILDTDTLRKYSWDEVRTDYKVLKRYDLSLEELERINHIITYP